MVDTTLAGYTKSVLEYYTVLGRAATAVNKVITEDVENITVIPRDSIHEAVIP